MHNDLEEAGLTPEEIAILPGYAWTEACQSGEDRFEHTTAYDKLLHYYTEVTHEMPHHVILDWAEPEWILDHLEALDII